VKVFSSVRFSFMPQKLSECEEQLKDLRPETPRLPPDGRRALKTSAEKQDGGHAAREACLTWREGLEGAVGPHKPQQQDYDAIRTRSVW